MNVFFVKMQESGSDYICIDCLKCDMDKKIELAVKMSRRHTGIGAAGLIFILPSVHTDCRVEIYNADGSRNMNGVDGIRCAARYVYDHYTGDSSEIRIETDRGIRTISIYDHLKDREEKCPIRQPVSVKMEIGEFSNLGEKRLPYPMQVVEVGETHCVIFTDKIEAIALEDMCREIRRIQMFGKCINIEVAEAECIMESEDVHIKMRIWEYGAGEVLSGSAAACAVSAAAVWQGYCHYDENIEVCQPGGVLTTAYLCDGRMILEGPAAYVYEGIWSC